MTQATEGRDMRRAFTVDHYGEIEVGSVAVLQPCAIAAGQGMFADAKPSCG